MTWKLVSPWAVLLLAACSADTYPVAVDSAEVRGSSIALQLDRSRADDPGDVLRVELHLAPEGELCPVLDDEVQLLLETDSGTTPLSVTGRGGGAQGIDCAIKCRELVALETVCAPIRAELRGGAVAAIASSATTAVRLSDSTGSLGVVLGPDAVAPRSVELLDGDTVSVGPADAATFSFTEVRFEWSHDDDLDFVSEWPEQLSGTRDGDFSEFNLVRDDDDAERIHVFTVRNTADRGERRVFFGGSTGVETCELGRCAGIGHLIAATVHVVDE